MARLSGTLVALDFDHTVIGCNSDTHVVEQLSNDTPGSMARLKDFGSRNAWTHGMDSGWSLICVRAHLLVYAIAAVRRYFLTETDRQGVPAD